MQTPRTEVRWEGEVVGHIESVGLDMFHFYGKWIPAQSDAASRFTNELAAKGSVWVQLLTTSGGPVFGEVTEIYDGVIDVLIHPTATP
jgi:hypothetical protein